MRRLAERMNAARAAGAPSIQAGEIGALGLLHEIGHLLIARYEAEHGPGAMDGALARPRDAAWSAMSIACWTDSRDEFPDEGRDPEPRARAPRGTAPDADRQREPGDRAAARTRR